MVKPMVRKFLLHPKVRNRLRELYVDDIRAEMTTEYWNLLLRDNVWFFTLMKSGTTFMLNAIAAYRSLGNGSGDVAFDFDHIHHFGVIRDWDQVAFDRLVEYATAGVRSRSVILHSHTPCDAEFGKGVFMIRGPYDFLVSSYHFHYRNRRNRSNTAFAEALPSMMRHYTTCYRSQERLIAESGRPTLQIWYEEFMQEPAASLACVLEFIGEAVDLERVDRAIEMCSVSRLRAHERTAGKAIVANGSYTKAHFVRSGRVGEYRDALTPEQIALVSSELHRAGLSHLVVEVDHD